MSDKIADTSIEGLVSRWAEGTGPGCAIAVLREGRVENTVCVGLASIEHRAPIRPDTVFRIASITKQFLCGAVLSLADEGRLDPDAELGTYLPELSGAPAGATVRQAMQNISGIRDSLELLALSGGGLAVPHRVGEAFRMAARQRCTNFEPGASFLYSNANFLLLSLIVERVADRSLAEVLHDRLFQPLGMARTRLVSQHDEVIDDFATGYVERPDGSFGKGQMTMALTGEGGMVSTLGDMILWLQYYRSDPDGLISRLAAPARFNSGRTGHYGCGLACETYRGLASIGHGGLWPGYRSEIVWFPGPDLGILCLANVNAIDPHGVTRAIADAVLADDLQPPATIASGLRQSAIAGSPFVDPERLELIELVDDGKDGLAAVLHGSRSALLFETPTRVRLIRGSCEYAGFDLAGVDDGLVQAMGVNGEETNLVSAARLAEVDGDWSDYEGYYASNDLDSEIRVTHDRGTLKATILGRYTDTPSWVLTPRTGNIMTMDENSGPWLRRIIVQFQRASDGRITGLLANGARVKRMSFHRSLQAPR